MRDVIFQNRGRYLAVIIVCIVYTVGLHLARPKWYRAETTLAFKNLSEQQQFDISGLQTNPLPIVFEETAVEQQYELSNIIYSVNMADRVIGDRLNSLYDPKEYDGITDFYDKFLLNLSYEYDGDRNVLKLSYTYKDPELAADFCNRFASGLEDFMEEAVQATYVSPILRARLARAKDEEKVAQTEVNRIAQLYQVPDLLAAPKEWVKAYAKALERSYISEAETESVLAALRQIRENRKRRDLLSEPQSPPDTTMVKDLVLAGLRFRLAMINAMSEVSRESLAPGNVKRMRLDQEAASLSAYIADQYKLGLDVEKDTLLIELQKDIIKNYLYKARAEATYSQLEKLPKLEAEIRPAIRAQNAANATVDFLDRISSIVEIGEEYGVHPVRVIDSAIVPTQPVQPYWKTLAYLVPTMLFLSTLWFSLTTRITREIAGDAGHAIEDSEDKA